MEFIPFNKCLFIKTGWKSKPIRLDSLRFDLCRFGSAFEFEFALMLIVIVILKLLQAIRWLGNGKIASRMYVNVRFTSTHTQVSQCSCCLCMHACHSQRFIANNIVDSMHLMCFYAINVCAQKCRLKCEIIWIWWDVKVSEIERRQPYHCHCYCATNLFSFPFIIAPSINLLRCVALSWVSFSRNDCVVFVAFVQIK